MLYNARLIYGHLVIFLISLFAIFTAPIFRVVFTKFLMMITQTHIVTRKCGDGCSDETGHGHNGGFDPGAIQRQSP